MTPDSDRESPGDLPVVAPPESDAGRVRTGAVAGVLLAAGASSRFGDANKLLATLDGDALVRRAARPLVEADVSPRVAVVGYEADRVRDALDGLDFDVVHNPDYDRGQATSVRTGIEAIDRAASDDEATTDDEAPSDDVAGAVFALGDMPFVEPATVDALVESYRAGKGAALAAAYDGRRGNPVVFDARYFDALADVSGDVGGREILLSGDESVLVETGDPGVREDIDTRDELDRHR